MSMPTATAIVNEARRLADERPEFVYIPEKSAEPGEGICLYLHGKGTDKVEGGCIFGQAMLNLGTPTATIEYHEDRPISSVLDSFPGILSVEDRSWAGRMQSYQDGGKPWGEAKELSDKPGRWA